VKTRVPGGRQLNILVVDDEPGARMALSLVLKLDGHHAILAGDAEEALKLFENAAAPFDLVITDHNMSGLSGVGLVRKLREKAFTGEIFVVTAHADMAAEDEYRKLGVAGIMAKPFTIADLRQWLNCIQDCRERVSSGAGKPQCPPGAMDFCWPKRD
jgi:two-component system, cell cycle response regulator CpdR